MASTPIPPSAGGEIDRIRSLVAVRFPVYETRVSPRSVVLLVHADPATLEERFDALRREMWDRFYVPQLRRQGGEYVIEVVRRPPQTPWGPWANLLLLLFTIASTIAAGAFLWDDWRGGQTPIPSDFLYGGLFFALPLMTILGCHELAHYVMARRHHVEASLPYFIPVPPPFLLFGTFGAFISLREPIPSKKALLDIGAAGPLAGLAVAIPVTLAGLSLSTHAPSLPLSYCGANIAGFSYGGLDFGGSIIWSILGLFVPASAFMHLHPLALAGWVGLLVTAINLLPAGQLDGGHVFRALLGDRARFVSYAAVVLLVIMGLYYEGWFLFALLVFLLGVRHPPPLNDLTPLDWRRYAVGGLAAAVLVGGFVVIPIAEGPAADFSLSSPLVASGHAPPGYAMSDNISFTMRNHDAVPHAYVVEAQILAVTSTVNGTSVPLAGSALAAFNASATWSLTLPSGMTVYFPSNGSFTLAPSYAFQLDSGSEAALHVGFLDTSQGVVAAGITVVELCSTGSGTQTVTVTLS